MRKLLFILPILINTAFALTLCDTKINLNDEVPQKWGMQNKKVFNVFLLEYKMKTAQENCVVYIDPTNKKAVKIMKNNIVPTVAASYPGSLQNMQFDFGELVYKDENLPKQHLKTESFKDFSDTNIKYIDVIVRSKVVYKNEKNGDRAWIETRCSASENCITYFALYSGEYLNAEKVQNKLYKKNVEKEIGNVKGMKK